MEHLINYRFLVLHDKTGEIKLKLGSKRMLPGLLSKGMQLLHYNGKLYDVIETVLDMETTEPEMHVELKEVKNK